MQIFHFMHPFFRFFNHPNEEHFIKRLSLIQFHRQCKTSSICHHQTICTLNCNFTECKNQSQPLFFLCKRICQSNWKSKDGNRELSHSIGKIAFHFKCFCHGNVRFALLHSLRCGWSMACCNANIGSTEFIKLMQFLSCPVECSSLSSAFICIHKFSSSDFTMFSHVNDLFSFRQMLVIFAQCEIN